ncbi:MAG TPA: hypothetical protein VK590_05930 [Saprospiraceae bacterium]|nr:hypothetical protein [Saprospiraceae bacterium]
MEDFIKQMIEEKFREEFIKDTEYVGELPSHFSDKLRALRTERERFDEDLDLRKRQYSLEAKRKIEEEFDSRNEEHVKEHKKTWNEIYRVMNIDPDGCYFNRDGKLFAEKSSDDTDSWMNKEMDFTKPFRTERH